MWRHLLYVACTGEDLSDTVGRQMSPILAVLERTEERARALERENGVLTERVTGLEREITGVRQAADADRQRLCVELEAASHALLDAKARESNLAEELQRSRAALTAERSIGTSHSRSAVRGRRRQAALTAERSISPPPLTMAPLTWHQRWLPRMAIALMGVLIVAIVVLLLFILPPLDAFM